MTRKALVGLFFAVVLLCVALSNAFATVALSPLFSNNMVLQRNKAVPVFGTAIVGRTITVTFNGQTKTAIVDSQGNWQATLTAMAAKAVGGSMTVSESLGGNTVTITNVVVGEVWLCSGQSNMDHWLGGCDRQVDIDSANYPSIRYFGVPVVQSAEPTKSFTGNWQVCSPSVAAGFSAVPFYFARKIYQNLGSGIPVGIIKCVQGGTTIDHWLAPEGAMDIPVLQPLYAMPIVQWGPFCLFNGMVYPLAPYGVKGILWYQGEYGESTNQSADSYYLKEKALISGWRRLWGEELPFYLVQLANLDAAPANATPEVGGWPLIREFQKDAMAISHTGMASALDVGEQNDIHPKDKLDVAERLALWAMKNEYGQPGIVPSGPILKDVTISGSTLVCSFDYIGAGLMVGSKTPYLPTVEVVGGTLQRFSIAGSNGVWYAATAVISGSTVIVSSPSVTTPRKIAYAYWKNPTGFNLYNRDGLPASPFYVDDVTVKYAINASAGAGGTISPAGVTSYFKRSTVGYTITPNAGFYITNVYVDDAPVGSVSSYTFDPLYAGHTIYASFAATAPSYTVNATAGAGGTISSPGSASVAQGGSKTYLITPGANSKIASVLVDGAPVGKRSSYAFNDVRANHTISATFSCLINASAGYGGTISPGGAAAVTYGTNQTFTFTPITGYAVGSIVVDGVNVAPASSYTFSNVTANHTIYVTFVGSGSGNIPQTGQIIFSALASTLPASGSTGSWATYLPSGQLTMIASPTAETINGRKWEKNLYADGDGYRFGSSYASPIVCTGASVVVAVKPTRSSDMGNWRSIVDVFYDRLVFGLTNDSGQVCVRRNGSADYSTVTIPDGQITVLSLVVQSNGTYKVWANGTQIYANTGTSVMTSLVPGIAGGAGGFGSYITVGRNYPDGWTTFNGNIGDVFLYKTALSDTDRLLLEKYIANKFIDFKINASAGTGGTISPAGATTVIPGANQTYTIIPSAGYVIGEVTVDGESAGAIGSYTFSNVTTNHTIAATFVQIVPAASISVIKATAAGTCVNLTGTEIVTYAPRNASNARSTTFFYVGEAQGRGCLKVVDKVSDSLTYGNKISLPGGLTGYVRKPVGGEIYLELISDPTGGGNFALAPLGLNNKSLLLDNKAQTNKVVVWGKVKSVNGTVSFTIDDGYGSNVAITINGVSLPADLAVAKTVVVTGILTKDGSGNVIVLAQTVRTF